MADERQEAGGTVYLFPIAHLDTQWRWTVRDTIRDFLPATLKANRDRFRRFPNYCVNFDGAFRYALIQEYFPEAWEELRQWVAEGRWKVSGAFWDACDVNVPSPESLVRQALYGRRFFRHELGCDPRDLFLPDCFGFGAHLPTVAAHCGLRGFASSKLRRGPEMRSAIGIPFAVGLWEGPDGSTLLAALDPGGYGEKLLVPPGEDAEILGQLAEQEARGGGRIAVRFFGIGDQGGAPDAKSLTVLEKAAQRKEGVLTRPAGSDETFGELAARPDDWPHFRGDLLLRLHGTGCYTSQAAMKRWNRKNELLAEAAEKAAAAAAWLGGTEYPEKTLRQAWKRFLWHQFHDDLTGTSIPAAYAISWHDEALAANQLASVLTHSVGHVARALDTRVAGLPLVVFNPLSQPRCDVVTATVPLPSGTGSVTVIGPDGHEVPAQLEAKGPEGTAISFLADLPSLGFAVFDVVGAGSQDDAPPRPLDTLENDRYRGELDGEGNLASLFDKALGRDLLHGPVHLELLRDGSYRFPAWEIHYRDLAHPPLARVGGPTRLTTRAHGPVRTVIEVERRYRRSLFLQRYELARGDAGDRLEIANRILWQTRGRLLKASFPLAAESDEAVFDLGVATIRRGIARPELYEVPAQHWVAQQTADDGGWGAAVLTDCKYGWDKPSADRLRLTLLHTPATGRRFPHQAWQDLGEHKFRYALTGYSDDWRSAQIPWQAARHNQPPLPFLVSPSPGPLGRRWSFLELPSPQAAVRAVKRREEGPGWVVRVHELAGEEGETELRFAAPVSTKQSLDGCEDTLGPPAPAAGNTLPLTLAPYRPLTLGVVLQSPADPIPATHQQLLPLPWNENVVTAQGRRGRGMGIDGKGTTLPAELWPQHVAWSGLSFSLGPTDGPQAVACHGQRISLPSGEWDHLVLLAASRQHTNLLRCAIGGRGHLLRVPAATAALASWDRVRRWGWRQFSIWRRIPGFLESTPVGWVASHCHDRKGRDLPYHTGCLFALRIALENCAEGCDLQLPETPDVLLFALALTRSSALATRATVPLYD